MNPPPPRYCKRALRAAAKGLGLKLVVLFGSRAGGRLKPGPESDLDLAVLDTRPFGRPRFGLLDQTLSRVFGKEELDLVLLNQADPLFRHEIFLHGKLLYGKILDFLEYKAYVFRDYVDSRDLFKLQESLLDKKLSRLRGQLHGAS